MDGFVAHCLELLATAGVTRAKRMFGGHGLYVDELFVAVIVADRLYLKANADTRARFEAAACTQWVYDGKDAPVAMSYWSVPDEAMDSPALMAPWALLAKEAARAAALGRKPRPMKRTASAPRSSAKKASAPRA